MIRFASPEDIPAINAILNDPSVIPGATAGIQVGAAGLDVGPIFGDLIILLDEGICFLFELHSADVFQVHTCVTKAKRGRVAYEAAQDAAQMMFTATSCETILTKVRAGDRATRAFTLAAGFRLLAENPAWAYFRLDWTDWAFQALGPLAAGKSMGVAFPESAVRLVGACLLTAQAGWGGKAVRVYNLLAPILALQPALVENPEPFTVSFGSARVIFGEQGYTVMPAEV